MKFFINPSNTYCPFVNSTGDTYTHDVALAMEKALKVCFIPSSSHGFVIYRLAIHMDGTQVTCVKHNG